MCSVISEILGGSQFWATFVGIIIAAVIGNYYWAKQHQKQLKRDLELDFFKRLNGVIYDLMIALTTASSDYFTVFNNLKYHVRNPELFKFNSLEERGKMLNNFNSLGIKISIFFSEIEGNEIIIFRYIHYRKFFTFKMEEIDNISHECMADLVDVNAKLTSEEGFSKFANKCKIAQDKYTCFIAYLHDYRNELMNYFMADLFGRKMPERVPIDPIFQPLNKVATKEAVEEEERRRNANLTNGING
jgi:hypothetical protein